MVFSEHSVLAIYGSPRRGGNSDILLGQAVVGARDAGVEVTEVFLRELTISPCVEDYGCLKDGRCTIVDDFQEVYDSLATCRGLILASPVFFCAVSAHTKIFMDRCQAFWVRKNLLGRKRLIETNVESKGIFISVAARKSPRNFDGPLLSVRHFFEALDVELWKSLLFPGVDRAGEILACPDALEECRKAGFDLAQRILSEAS